MATTTNFGWETPDDTDLVKDGAAAMRTLGNAIDTSLVDLKGGTTGQVLSKTSNTDMDFTWVTTDDANAIQNTIVDAKGDLISATAADTPARLAVGTNGQVLTADSSTATGLKWAAAASGGGYFANPVLNSNFSVWQRGTSFSLAASTTAANGYTADRWDTATGANQACTLSRQTTSDTTNLPNIQYCMRYQRNSGQTGTGALTLAQNFETINSIRFAGKSVTFSFYARAGANYSAASSALNVYVWSGTGTDQNVLGAGFTGQSAFINSSATLTTTWQRFTFTASVASTATQIATGVSFTPVGTAGAADYFEITGIQLEVGSSATDYYPYGATYQAELAACQRYYIRYDAATTYQTFGLVVASSTTGAYVTLPLPVQMRVVPTAIDASAAGTFRLQSNQNIELTSIALGTIGNGNKVGCVSVGVASGLTAGNFYFLLADADTTAYLGFTAEL
jgi:hypothetical protein